MLTYIVTEEEERERLAREEEAWKRPDGRFHVSGHCGCCVLQAGSWNVRGEVSHRHRGVGWVGGSVPAARCSIVLLEGLSSLLHHDGARRECRFWARTRTLARGAAWFDAALLGHNSSAVRPVVGRQTGRVGSVTNDEPRGAREARFCSDR